MNAAQDTTVQNLTEWHHAHTWSHAVHPSGTVILTIRTPGPNFEYHIFPDGHFQTPDTDDALLQEWIERNG